MASTNCPICGSDKFVQKNGEYRFSPPPQILNKPITIANAVWWECSECGEKVLSHELDKAIDAEVSKHLELLTPEEIRQVRQRTGLSAVDMAHVLGVGEKTYTRWETGKSIQNKANDTLIRLLDDNAEALAIVQAARQPNREATISQYIQQLKHIKGGNSLAMAAHGGDLGEAVTKALRKRIQELANG